MKVGTGAVALGGAVGGLVMLQRVRDSGGDPYSGTWVGNGILLPRREVLENTAAWAGALALAAGGMHVNAGGGPLASAGLLGAMAGVGFMAGQVAALVP